MSDDHLAIQNLIARYALLVDTGDFAGVGELLADATFAGAAGEVTSREAITGMLETIAAGRYRDTFARRDGRWRFTERRVTIHLRGDLSRHLRS